jgi:hypothetical protein
VLKQIKSLFPFELFLPMKNPFDRHYDNNNQLFFSNKYPSLQQQQQQQLLLTSLQSVFKCFCFSSPGFFLQNSRHTKTFIFLWDELNRKQAVNFCFLNLQFFSSPDIGDIRQQQPGQQQQDGGERERGGSLVALGKNYQRVGHVVKEASSTNKGTSKS